MHRITFMSIALFMCSCNTDFTQADYCLTHPEHPECRQLVVSGDGIGPRSHDSTVSNDTTPDVKDDEDEGSTDIVSDEVTDILGSEEIPDTKNGEDAEDIVEIIEVDDTVDTDDGDQPDDTEDVPEIDQEAEVSDNDIDDTDTDEVDPDIVPDTDSSEEPECEINDDCLSLDDGDLCNDHWDCIDNTCVLIDEKVDCSKTATLACFVAVCNPETGTCQPSMIDNDTSCDDENPCTDNDVCTDGICSGEDITCPCVDALDCIEFDDENLCNGSFICDTGDCKLDPDSIVTCEAKDACETSACEPESGTCTTSSVTCTDDIECTDNSCDPDMGCITTLDHPFCDDDNDCTKDSCDADKDCVHETQLGSCDDGDPCTNEDACTADVNCVGTPIVCNDGDVCTDDSCSGGACKFVPNISPCNDNDTCTTDDVCSGGVCGGTLICDCTTHADCADLNDLNVCNGVYGCDKSTDAWTCKIDPTTIITCSAPPANSCLSSSCVPSTGACVDSQLSVGTICDDGDACTSNDACGLTGVCNGDSISCNDGNVCTNDSCDSVTGCAHEPSGEKPCDDENGDTVVDTCIAGVCTGTVLFVETFDEGLPEGWTFAESADGNLVFTLSEEPWDGEPGNYFLGATLLSAITISEPLTLKVYTPVLDIPKSESPKLAFLRWGTQPCSKAKVSILVDDVYVEGVCGNESKTGTMIPLNPDVSQIIVTFDFTLQPGTYNAGLLYRIDQVAVKD